MFKSIITLVMLGLFAGQALAGVAIGRVTTNAQQEHDCQVYKAWGWPVETHNFFDSSDDEVKCPPKKLVRLEVPARKEK